jgi:hypothetical protein
MNRGIILNYKILKFFGITTLIKNIEIQVEYTKKRRISYPKKANIFGEDLYYEVKTNLTLMGQVYGINHVKYKNVADGVAIEILECVIVFFENYKDLDLSPVEVVRLIDKAKQLASSEELKQRMQQRIEKKLQKRLDANLSSLLELLKSFEKKAEFPTSHFLWENKIYLDNTKIKYAEELIEKAVPELINIEEILGRSNDLYMKLSTKVVSIAQSMIIEGVNSALETSLTAPNKTFNLEIIIAYAMDVFNAIGLLDLETDYRDNHYLPNYDNLSKIFESLGSEPLLMENYQFYFKICKIMSRNIGGGESISEIMYENYSMKATEKAIVITVSICIKAILLCVLIGGIIGNIVESITVWKGIGLGVVYGLFIASLIVAIMANQIKMTICFLLSALTGGIIEWLIGTPIDDITFWGRGIPIGMLGGFIITSLIIAIKGKIKF